MNIKEEAMFAAASLMHQLEIDIVPTGNEKSSDGIFKIQYKADEFIRGTKCKASIWIVNRRDDNFIDAVVNLIIWGELIEKELRLFYDKESKKWEIGRL